MAIATVRQWLRHRFEAIFSAFLGGLGCAGSPACVRILFWW